MFLDGGNDVKLIIISKALSFPVVGVSPMLVFSTDIHLVGARVSRAP